MLFYLHLLCTSYEILSYCNLHVFHMYGLYPYIPTSKLLLQDVVIGLNYHHTVVFVDFNHSFILLNRFRTCISQLCYL